MFTPDKIERLRRINEKRLAKKAGIASSTPPLLFERPSPLSDDPGIKAALDLLEQALLYEDAKALALKWIVEVHGTAREFIGHLVSKLGDTVKMELGELTAELLTHPTLTKPDREYVAASLNMVDIEAALSGHEKHRVREENTLDAMFRQAVQFRKSQKFTEAVNFVSKFRDYAPYNCMLVFLQRPWATLWATASDWRRKFRRTVTEDAIPLIMLQPMGPIMLAYDVADTEGPPLPQRLQKLMTVEGEFDEGLLARAAKEAHREGIRIKNRKLGQLHGGTAIRSWAKRVSLTVEINDALKPAEQYAVLCHELGHILLGHLGGHPEGKWPSRMALTRQQREIEAEAVAFIVCHRQGLTTSSAEYLAGYLQDPKEQEGISVDCIMKVAGRIERMSGHSYEIDGEKEE